jgi:hypothetical protein
MSLFLGFTERKNFGRALFPVNPMGEVINFNQLLIDEFAPKYGIPFSAWSCARRLWTGYTGNLIEVRRSTDNALLDIGYNSENELDTATLLGFLGGASGLVRTLYDQTGAGNHFQQTTLANQPRIVNAGVLETRNGKPSMFFDGTNDNMAVGSSTATYKWLHDTASISDIQHIYIIAEVSNATTTLKIFLGNGGAASATTGIIFFSNVISSTNLNCGVQMTRGVGGSFVLSFSASNTVTPNKLSLFGARLNKNRILPIERANVLVDRNIFIENNSASGATSNNNASQNLTLGSEGNNTLYFNGYISECILYQNVDNQLNVFQNEQGKFYGI